VRYVIDPRASRVTVQAFAGGMLGALGHDPTFAARRFTGEVVFDPATPDAASLTLTIKAIALELIDDVSASDRRTIERVLHEEVLASSTFPEIVYRASSAVVTPKGAGQYQVDLAGELTLHGLTRREPVSAHAMISQTMLRAHGELTISQRAFGIHQVSVGGSMLKVKDALSGKFDIVARP
jgi:polyisoprenoid-binding protein YceI